MPHARPLQRVPVVHGVVHRALPLVDLPVAGRPQDGARFARKGRGRGEPVHCQHRSHARPLQDVVGEEQPPAAVVGLERRWVDREALVRRQVDALVDVRAGGVVGHGDPEMVAGVTDTDRVVHPPTPVDVRHLGRPEVDAHAARHLQGASDTAPLHEVVGPQHLERATVDQPTRADGHEAVVGRHDERVREVVVVHRVAVRHGHARMLPSARVRRAVTKSLPGQQPSRWRSPVRRVAIPSTACCAAAKIRCSDPSGRRSPPMTHTVVPRRFSRYRATLGTAVAAGSLTAGSILAAPIATAAPVPPGQRTPYVNPVSRTFADTFADPSVIRGKDGWWYAYGTSDPLREGEGAAHRIPIARSRDLVSWRHAGDAFSDTTLPKWAAPSAGIWAPDIRYVDGQYRMYYVVTETTASDQSGDNAVGMATAPTPTGPWTDSGAPVVGPRRDASGNAFLWTFDPTAVTDADGSQWLFYGSYFGGIFVTRLSDDGRRAVGTPTQVAIDNKFEGAYVIRRGGYWSLFASTANCCAGPTTGYSVQVGRSRDLRGPYVDREGVPLTASRAGGTPTLVQNGNQWIGAGHNAVVTDLAGQDWIAYHAIDRRDPYLDGTGGINERPMLLDRLDWVGGWPAVRAGRGPSGGAQTGPLTCGTTCSTNGLGGAGWTASGRWSTASDAQAGRYARSRGTGTLTRRAGPADLWVEADLRSTNGSYGLVAGAHGARNGLQVLVNPGTGRITLQLTARGRTTARTSAALPPSMDTADWHSLSLEVRGRLARAQLTHARLGDPLADLQLRLPNAVTRGRAGAVARTAGVGVDNLSVQRAARPVRRLARVHVPSRPDRASSDEFNGSSPAPGWTWVRRDAAATVSGGRLNWPTEAADLGGPGSSAAVLLRDLGDGPWTAQTK